MRLLLGPDPEAGHPDGELASDQLREAYAAPSTPWLRVNMVSTLDGAATGEGGTTGSINNAADKRVFDLLRELADALVVGAGTARIEGYRPTGKPTVVVTRSGRVPDRLGDAEPGRVMIATCQASPGLAQARRLLGNEHVLVLGSHRVDLPGLKQALAERGYTHLLSEGGPHLLRDLLDQGVADEVNATITPRIIAGAHLRMTEGPPVDVPLRLHALLEEDGTLLGRWLVSRR